MHSAIAAGGRRAPAPQHPLVLRASPQALLHHWTVVTSAPLLAGLEPEEEHPWHWQLLPPRGLPQADPPGTGMGLKRG